MAQEKTFERKVRTYIEEQGGWVVKYFANRMTKVGIPDLLACVNGIFIAIEVKAEKGKASELQLYNIEEIRKAGGVAIVLYPHQFREFKEIITEIKARKPYICEPQYLFDGEVRT